MDKIGVALEPDELRLLRHGLGEWGGPAFATEELAAAMGFGSLEAMPAEVERLRAALDAGEPLVAEDWSRALAATEIAFASEIWGSGWDWENTWGPDDEGTIRLLREVQKKLRLAHALARLGTREGRHPV